MDNLNPKNNKQEHEVLASNPSEASPETEDNTAKDTLENTPAFIPEEEGDTEDNAEDAAPVEESLPPVEEDATPVEEEDKEYEDDDDENEDEDEDDDDENKSTNNSKPPTKQPIIDDDWLAALESDDFTS